MAISQRLSASRTAKCTDCQRLDEILPEAGAFYVMATVVTMLIF